MAQSRRRLAATVASQLIAAPDDHAHIMQQAAAYLLDHKLADSADLFMNDLAHELFVQTGQLTAEVTTARPASDAVIADIVAHLKQVTGARDVTVNATTDPELLGGFVAKTAESELNRSVQHQLSQLRGIA